MNRRLKARETKLEAKEEPVEESKEFEMFKIKRNEEKEKALGKKEADLIEREEKLRKEEKE